MDGAMWIPEFEHECGETRKALERVPDDKLEWRPHEKSWTLGELAGHVANLPSWVSITMNQDELDLDEPFDWEPPTSRDALVAELDKNVEEGKQVLQATPASTMGQPWRLLQGGEVTLEMPKGAILRTFIISHMIHHRAQLGMYLRLLDVPVPGHYGPSADDLAEAANG